MGCGASTGLEDNGTDSGNSQTKDSSVGVVDNDSGTVNNSTDSGVSETVDSSFEQDGSVFVDDSSTTNDGSVCDSGHKKDSSGDDECDRDDDSPWREQSFHCCMKSCYKELKELKELSHNNGHKNNYHLRCMMLCDH